MLGGRNWLRKAAMLLALCAGSVAASAPRAAELGAGVDGRPRRAVPSRRQHSPAAARRQRARLQHAGRHMCRLRRLFDRRSTCRCASISPRRRRAAGRSRKPTGSTIDYGAGTASLRRARREPIAPGTIRETPEGWCVQTAALSRWFGIGVKPMTVGLGAGASVRREASGRARDGTPAARRAASTRRASTSRACRRCGSPIGCGARRRSTSWSAAGSPTAPATASASIAKLRSTPPAKSRTCPTTRRSRPPTEGKPSLLRLRAYRSDPDGNLLGPLHATHFGVGDVEGFDSRLTGVVAGGPRRGRHQSAADRAHGVRPHALRRRSADRLGSRDSIATASCSASPSPTPSQRYVFDNVQLLYGENRIRDRPLRAAGAGADARRDRSTSARTTCPTGKTWYWAGVNQPGRDLVTLEKPPDAPDLPKAQAAVSVEHGIDDRTSVGVLARAMLIDDERLTFVEGTVRRSIGPAHGRGRRRARIERRNGRARPDAGQVRPRQRQRRGAYRE